MRIFSFGGGVQSVAVMVMQSRGMIQYDHFVTLLDALEAFQKEMIP